jgi:hypothetical protein
MLLADGDARLCELQDVSLPGRAPKRALVEVDQFAYSEQSLGYNRVYVARAQGQEIERVVRTWPIAARPNMYAITEDGEQWRIATVQRLTDDDGLPCMDLALERLGDFFDVEPTD